MSINVIGCAVVSESEPLFLLAWRTRHKHSQLPWSGVGRHTDLKSSVLPTYIYAGLVADTVRFGIPSVQYSHRAAAKTGYPVQLRRSQR